MSANTKYLKRKHVSKFLQSAQFLGKRGVLHNDYDEPTYVGFWVEFDFVGPSLDDPALINYNRMPNGLLGTENGTYSAEKYLRSINEDRKADMINAFNKLLRDISKETPDAIASISGLDSLYKLDPTKSWRASEAEITLNFEESIDNRINALFDLYRQGAFDASFMRWVLPDIHRFFKMNIYVTEFRAFHVPRGNNERATLEENEDFINIGDQNRSGKSFLNQQVDGYKTQFNNISDSINERTTTGPDGQSRLASEVSSGSFFSAQTSDDISTNDYFLKVLDKNLTILKFELGDCEIVLPELAPSWTQEISNQIHGESLTAAMKIKIGNICEVNEYSALGASLFQGLDNLSDYVLSCKFKTQKTDIDKYFEILGDSSKSTADSVYSDVNYPYGKGHLTNSDNEIFKGIGERLLENSFTLLESTIQNAVSEEVNGVFLGNVYDFSAASAFRSLSADPRAIGASLSQIINNANGSENGGEILNNINLEITRAPDLIKNNPKLELNFSETRDQNPGSADIESVDPQEQDPGNSGLTQVEINESSPGNIGLLSTPTNPGNPGSIDLRIPEKAQANQENVDLNSPDSPQASPQNADLNFTEPQNQSTGNIELTQVPNSEADTGNIGLSDVPVNDISELGNQDLNFRETTDENPGNVDLDEISISEGNLSNVGLDINEVQSDTEDNVDLNYPPINDADQNNVQLTQVESSNDQPNNVGIDFSESTDTNLDNLELNYPSKSTTKEENVGLDNVEIKSDRPTNVGLEIDENINKTDKNVDLNYVNNKSSVDENINLSEVELKSKRPQSVDLKFNTNPEAENDNVDLDYPKKINKENEPVENISLSEVNDPKNTVNNVDINYIEQKKKERPTKIEIDGDYLRKEALGKIELKGQESTGKIDTKVNVSYPQKDKNEPGNSGIEYEYTTEKDVIGNTQEESPENETNLDNKNAGLKYRDHKTFPKEGTEIQSTKPIKKPKRKNE